MYQSDELVVLSDMYQSDELSCRTSIVSVERAPFFVARQKLASRSPSPHRDLLILSCLPTRITGTALLSVIQTRPSMLPHFDARCDFLSISCRSRSPTLHSSQLLLRQPHIAFFLRSTLRPSRCREACTHIAAPAICVMFRCARPYRAAYDSVV